MTEANLENKLIHDLKILGYKEVKVKDVDSLMINLREKLELLNDYKFTDEEFKTIEIMLNKGSVFDKALLLRSGYDFRNEDRIQKEIIFFNTDDWCKNIFEVTNQVKMKGSSNNRYDVTLLINGFPLVQIELKKPTVSEFEPIGQIRRYKEDTMDDTIFDFVQLFIISNGNNTMYCANNKGTIDKNFIFNYADFNNRKIYNLSEFASVFLEPCQIGKFIARYMIMSQEDDKQTIMAMRSYQIHAVEKILSTLDGSVKNGYVWHTTGSGKTLTSFKACEIISNRTDVDKVLFIVDRKALDRQTVSEYQKFKSNASEDIPTISTTRELIKYMNNSQNKLLVTSIQKLEKAIKKEKIDSNKRVVLVFDECHRSQLGNMHQNIDSFFNHPFKFGFTGTPILAANVSVGGEEFRTTEDVFGQALHKYLINDAIDDKNVLGFHIDYKSVIQPKDILEDEEIDYVEEKEVLHSLSYISKVANDVLDTYNIFTQNGLFNALLACDGIDQALKYYNYIKGYEQTDRGRVYKREASKLKVACIFSFSDNEEHNEDGFTRRTLLKNIIKDYNEDFNTDYSIDTYENFKNDVSKKMKSREIDLLIVSDMFLTGFDAKKLNTLYFDKEQKYHNLIQSLSRTNRVFGKLKDFGNIISYRPRLEKNVDEALELFSNPNSETSVLKKSYDEQLEFLNECLDVLVEKYPTIESVLELKGKEAKMEFVNLMRNVNSNINKVITYREFEEEDLRGLTFNDIEQYKVQYQNIYDQEMKKVKKGEDSIVDDFDFEINLLHTVKVDYDYIKRLLIEHIESVPEDRLDDAKQKLYKLIEADPQKQSKLEFIQRFLESYFDVNRGVESQFEQYVEVRTNEAVEEFSEENNLNTDSLFELVEEYDYSSDIGNFQYSEVKKQVVKDVKLSKKRELKPLIDQFVVDLKNGDIF